MGDWSRRQPLSWCCSSPTSASALWWRRSKLTNCPTLVYPIVLPHLKNGGMPVPHGSYQCYASASGCSRLPSAPRPHRPQ
ncbi:unnamed protein product [Caretta caretta]